MYVYVYSRTQNNKNESSGPFSRHSICSSRSNLDIHVVGIKMRSVRNAVDPSQLSPRASSLNSSVASCRLGRLLRGDTGEVGGASQSGSTRPTSVALLLFLPRGTTPRVNFDFVYHFDGGVTCRARACEPTTRLKNSSNVYEGRLARD